jgi:hypothetical protein
MPNTHRQVIRDTLNAIRLPTSAHGLSLKLIHFSEKARLDLEFRATPFERLAGWIFW